MQHKHLGHNEATWEPKVSIREACKLLFSFDNIEDGILRGRGI